eukprot:s1345_g2.t1
MAKLQQPLLLNLPQEDFGEMEPPEPSSPSRLSRLRGRAPVADTSSAGSPTTSPVGRMNMRTFLQGLTTERGPLSSALLDFATSAREEEISETGELLSSSAFRSPVGEFFHDRDRGLQEVRFEVSGNEESDVEKGVDQDIEPGDREETGVCCNLWAHGYGPLTGSSSPSSTAGTCGAPQAPAEMESQETDYTIHVAESCASTEGSIIVQDSRAPTKQSPRTSDLSRHCLNIIDESKEWGEMSSTLEDSYDRRSRSAEKAAEKGGRSPRAAQIEVNSGASVNHIDPNLVRCSNWCLFFLEMWISTGCILLCAFRKDWCLCFLLALPHTLLVGIEVQLIGRDWAFRRNLHALQGSSRGSLGAGATGVNKRLLDVEKKKNEAEVLERRVQILEGPGAQLGYIFELESGLLTSLEEILPPAKPDTPNFDPNSNVSNEMGARQWKTSDGAEVLTLDHDANQIINTAAKRNYRERKSKTLTSTAQKNAKAEYKSTMERMSSVAERLRSLQLDEEESQRLQLMRLTKERRKRRSGATPASAPAVIRIPSGAGSSQEELQRKKPPELDDATPQPPLKRQDTVPPPPPPVEVMQEALAPQTVPVSASPVSDSFAPPAHPPSPTSGKRPELHQISLTAGAVPGLMREYRQRVLFAFNNLEGDGKDEAEEARDLAKKKQRFGKRLLDALHGEAYKACEELMTQHERLKEPEGKRGQPVDLYIRQRKQQWSELQDVAENVQMSEDLRAYFLLKHVGISREDRRTVLLANQSNYTMEGIEKALRTSFYDLHEKERQRDQSGLQKSWGRKGSSGRGMRSYAAAGSDDTMSSWAAVSETVDEQVFEDDEAEEAYAVDGNADEQALEPDAMDVSDYGASEDDEVYQAYSTYKDSRKKLKDIQKSRGYFKNDGKYQNHAARDQAKQAEKARSRCAACHRLGHWAGDPECPAGTRSGPKKVSKGGKGKGSGKGRAGKAYMVGESPTYFSLCEDLEDEEAYCDMVFDDDEANEMQQDSGLSATDLRRKTNQSGRTEADASTPMPWVSSGESPMVPIPVKDLRIYYVLDRDAERPDGLMEDKLSLRDLQSTCDRWEIKVTGTKAELRERLIRFFAGHAVVQKGYSKLYVQMKEKELPSSLDLPVKPKAKAKFKAPPVALTKAAASTSSMATPGRGYTSGSASDGGRVVVETMMMGNEDCRFFRPTEEHLQETPQKDPKTGIAVPEELEVGKPHAAIVCPFCGRPMVLRRHWSDSSLFFECSDPNCKSFISFKEGIEKLQASKGTKSGGSSASKSK